MAEQLLTLIDLSKYYTGSQSVVMGLNSVSLSFSRGEFVAVTGESGSGKSTLSHVIGGILPYESGELLLGGRPTSHYDGLDWERYRRDNISFISQNYGILPGATVLGNVVSALRLAGMDKEAARAAAEDILRQVELWELRRRRAAKLSSGQKQRLSIARALAKPAPILIADEPTGNLDAENSAKVISLLAQASRDRLVILVTHEFDEARDLATRHIVLQDGKVASDTALRPTPDPGPAPTAAKEKRQPLSPYVARLQAASRPVWTGLTACFFALTAFAVFAFLGVFIISLDDTPTRVYDNSVFRNGSPTRIVVQKPDQIPMTQEDRAAILSIPHVQSMDAWGYAADAQYAWQEGVDYRAVYSEHPAIMGDEEHYVIESLQIYSSAPFVQTVPLLPEGQSFLTDGRLPENFFEVAAAGDPGQIGQTVTVYFMDNNTWPKGSYVYTEVTIVGVTDRGSGLYFHDDVGRFFRTGWSMYNGSLLSGYLYFPVKDLEEGEFRGSTNLFFLTGLSVPNHAYQKTARLDPEDFSVIEEGGEFFYFLPAESYPDPPDWQALRWEAINEAFGSETPGLLDLPMLKRKFYIDDWAPFRMVELSYPDFQFFTWQSDSDQVSLTLEDYAYTDRVIEALEDMGYWAVSPYRLGSTKQDPDLAAEREQTLKVCLAALLAVIALQVVVLRALFSVENDSYRLLSNIGLTRRTARQSVLCQVVAFALMGQLIGGLGIWLCGLGGVERIQELLHWLPAPYVLVLSGVHLAASLLAAVWTVRALTRKVYPLVGKYSDLALDDGEEATA